MARAHFKGSFDQFKTFLRTSPQFYFKDAASLLSAYRDISKRADPQLAHLFRTLPRTPYGVLPVPDAVAPSQTTATTSRARFPPGGPGRCSRTPTSSTRVRSGRWRRFRCTRRCRAIICRSRSRRSCRTCRSSARTRATRRSSRAGRSTPRASATRWASTRTRTRSSASSPTRCGAPSGSSSTPACTRWAGRASRRSTSSPRTPRRRRRTSRSRSIATSSGRGRRSATRWASSRFRELRANAERQLGAQVRRPRVPRCAVAPGRPADGGGGEAR